MTRLEWNTNRIKYEVGVDRGVFYPSNGLASVWNGIISIDETPTGGAVSSYHYDGVKYMDLVGSKDYQATMTVFATPRLFASHIGERSVVPGLVLTRQSKQPFGFSYRSGLGPEEGYKIHLVYGVTASITRRGYSTIAESSQPSTTTYDLYAIPPRSTTYRPSAHFIIDSTKLNPEVLTVLEELLYGSLFTEPRLPSQEEIVDLATNWEPLLITLDEAEGLSELIPGYGDIYETRTDGLYQGLPNSRLRPSSYSGLYRME